MHPILRNILAVVAGLIVGLLVNMALVNLGPQLIPPPEGADITSMEGLKSTIHLMQPKHFLMPFLGHALGTLVGAALAAYLAVGNKMRPAMVVAAFFLLGGISMVYMLPSSPMWFNVADLGLAYLPMGWLGHRLTGGNKSW